MIFLSINRMRAYRTSGKVRLVLKLSLPKIEDENPFAEAFNSFYLSLADCYVSCAKDVRVPENPVRPAMLTVSFEDISDKYVSAHKRLLRKCGKPLVILRKVSLSFENKRTFNEFIDIYDIRRGVFVK